MRMEAILRDRCMERIGSLASVVIEQIGGIGNEGWWQRDVEGSRGERVRCVEIISGRRQKPQTFI